MKQRSILALLIANQGEVASTDRIVDEVYGEDAGAGVRRSVQTMVSVLRRVLGGVIVGTGEGGSLEHGSVRRFWVEVVGVRTCRVAAAIVAIAAVGCAAPYPDSVGADDSPATTRALNQVPKSRTTSTTTLTPPSTSTSEAPITTTTTSPELEIASAWVGVEFSVETTVPNVEGAAILANVEHFPVDFLIGDEPAGVFGWYVGGVVNAFDGPNFSVVVVADEPNPYSPTEYELFEDGVEPADPDPSVEHVLTVLAINDLGPTRYLITDAMDIELPAPLLHYGALMSVTQEPWMCDVDPALQPYIEPDPAGIHRADTLYGFFDAKEDEELEIDKHYPAVLAFAVSDGRLVTVSPDSVRCILRLDPENY